MSTTSCCAAQYIMRSVDGTTASSGMGHICFVPSWHIRTQGAWDFFCERCFPSALHSCLLLMIWDWITSSSCSHASSRPEPGKRILMMILTYLLGPRKSIALQFLQLSLLCSIRCMPFWLEYMYSRTWPGLWAFTFGFLLFGASFIVYMLCRLSYCI